MARTKRPYVPKTKGCYECSQRRVNCDRGEPDCAKCVAKGLECSGISNSKYKFRNRFVENKENGHKRPRLGSASSDGSASASPDSVAENASGQSTARARERSSYAAPDGSYSGLCGYQMSFDVWDDATISSLCRPPPLGIYTLDHIKPWQHVLLEHFSDHIAPEMVAIDDHSNGWRQLVLPLAWINDMVLNSVTAVAAFHLSERLATLHLPKNPPVPTLADPAILYSKAILELQKRRDLNSTDLEARHQIIVAIIVLLLATMVNGSSDFSIIFHMLQSAVGFVGGEEALAATGQTITDFLAIQIRKMRVYASPFISQDVGVRAIATQEHLGWDCPPVHFLPAHEHSDSLAIISSLRKLAFQIYLQRASATGTVALPSATLVSRFRLLLELLPEGVEGGHVLVWPVFIAACASYIPEYRSYFVRFLERQFLRNGFGNIPKALQSLSRIWTRNGDVNWVTLLPEQVVFVM